MRYIVTGGSGFVGSHLVEALLKQDEEVVVIDKITNHNNLSNIINNKNIKNYFVDISDPTITEKIIQKDDIVLHLAAQSHVDVSFSNPLETTKSNVLGTQSILNACLKKQSKKLIVMSTDEVYGSVSKILDSNLLDPTNPYSASKAAADMIVNSYKHMYKDMNIITLRSNNIVGKRQYIRNIIPRFTCLGLLNKKMTLHGSGLSKRRYLWVGDAVSALLLIADKAKINTIYNIGHDKSYSNLKIAEMIGRYLDLNDFISYEKDRVFNDTDYPCDYSKIQKDLNWKISKDLEDILPDTIEWYRDNIKMFEPLL